ncbi:hypothetical protein LCGC14_0669660, partial [marine sediment metagenome]
LRVPIQKNPLVLTLFVRGFSGVFPASSPLLEGISKKRRRKSLREVQDILEKAILIKVLSYVNGNQKDAANFLGIKYTTLNEKIKKYNIKFSKSPIEFNYRGGE